MGIGQLGNPNIVVKRKFRWLLEIQDDQGNVIVPSDFVKVSARPSIDLEEIDFLNQKSFIPGRLNSNDTTITYWEYEQSDGACHLTKWLAKHVPSDGNINLTSIPKANYILRLLDGCGNEMENWTLVDGILTSINFGELDHSSTECVSLELNVRYTKIHYKSTAPWSDGSGLGPSGIVTDEWKMPDEWVIRNPIVTESSSPGEQILDQFLRRTASK
jgi:hypothetical protein